MITLLLLLYLSTTAVVYRTSSCNYYCCCCVSYNTRTDEESVTGYLLHPPFLCCSGFRALCMYIYSCLFIQIQCSHTFLSYLRFLFVSLYDIIYNICVYTSIYSNMLSLLSRTSVTSYVLYCTAVNESQRIKEC